MNPSHEPNTMRYASARIEARENVDVSMWPNSPAAALRMMRITPAMSICIPALTNVRRGSGARRWYSDPIALSLLGAGAVASGVGVGFLVSAQSASSKSKTAPDYPTAQSLKHTAEQRGTIGMVSTIGGGALLAGGVVWIVLHRDTRERRAVTGWLSPGGGGLAITGPF